CHVVQHCLLQADRGCDRDVRQHGPEHGARAGRDQYRPVGDQEHEDRPDRQRGAVGSVQRAEPSAVREPERAARQLGVRDDFRDAREPVVRDVRHHGTADPACGEIEVLMLALVLAVTIDASTRIVVGPEEPPPVAAAARDLAGDLEKVLGQRPRIVQRLEDGGAAPIVIGFRSPFLQAWRFVGPPEAFSISTRDQAAVVAGGDMRGTMYAVYQFSEQFLGVDPLYYWTDHVPARTTRIEIPSSLDQTFPAPVFTYRGFFINDEDLLTGWAPAPPGE